MNFDEIHRTWRSVHNQPPAAQLQRDRQQFFRDLRRRRRGAAIFMIWILAVLTALTFRLGLFIFGPHPTPPGFDWRQEWSVLLLLALPWVCLGLFYRAFRRHGAAHPAFDQSIRDTLRGLLDENRLARQRQQWAALLAGATLLLLPLVVYQLRAVGKVGDEVLLPAFVMLPLILAAIQGGFLLYQRRVLSPRRRQLEALLAAYDDENQRGV